MLKLAKATLTFMFSNFIRTHAYNQSFHNLVQGDAESLFSCSAKSYCSLL